MKTGLFDRPGVFISGTGQLKVEKAYGLGIREMGAMAIQKAVEDAGVEKIDAVFVGNMLSGMISKQQQLGPLLASKAGLNGVEAVTLEAACASGGAALRAGFMAILSGMADTVVVCGVEKMSHLDKEYITQCIATASDWETEGSKGETFLTLNARLMQMYMDRYQVASENFGMFGVNAHRNANLNPNALFHKEISIEDYTNSKPISGPLRMYDASPICDGAAAIVLSRFPSPSAKAKNIPQVKITASASATEFVSINERQDALAASGVRLSGEKAYKMAGIGPGDVDFFELHDAYSIISTISLEAMGFANPGQGWKLAAEGHILKGGKLPVSTFGGLKARGHAIGATGVYQAIESYLQLTDRALHNRIEKEARVGLIQNIGGTASTAITHVLVRE